MTKPRWYKKMPLVEQNEGSKFTTAGRNAGQAAKRIAQEKDLQSVMDSVFDELMPSLKKKVS